MITRCARSIKLKQQQSADSLDETNIKYLLKHIEHEHQLLTFGFCRKNATMIEKIIPDPIINICLIYAFLIIEHLKHIVGDPQHLVHL